MVAPWKAEEFQATVSLTLSADDRTVQHAYFLTFPSEADTQFPDFLVVKATEGMNADRIIIVLELKRNDMANMANQTQLFEYMDRVALMPPNLFVDVVGYLVSPKMALEYRLRAPVAQNDRVMDLPLRMPTGSDAFVAAMHAFAVAEWNT